MGSVMEKSARWPCLAMLGATLGVSPNMAFAADHIGAITTLEVWKSGNVAFTLSGFAACNGQYILNVSSPGTKNIYAAVLAAKMAGKPIRVSHSVCGPAEGYGGNYAQVDYVYPQD